ncbi:hypothetical protein H6P81_001608 [Aristolochia fimbriata]|uniref:Uncharacterized protein n=1 Tax=Aristolochia fimbriata TaxID=158543 RepID=A0AAV7F7D8_ARIFI|nr:hypothetical protein H6P81_001608 [Aristolochia fimbriata]
MAMAVDDSFKRPGSVPFKWEISPGIPKPTSPTPSSASHKLAPPPLASAFSPPPAFAPLFLRRGGGGGGNMSHHRTARVTRRSAEHSAAGCFPVPPPLNRKTLKAHNQKPQLDLGRGGTDTDDENDCADMMADLQTLARWSMSSRKSLSPDSPPLVSSLGKSLRRAHDDPDWAAYGLF